MSSSFVASVRRANRLMGPRRQIKVIRDLQKATATAMVEAAFAPFTDPAPVSAKKRRKVMEPTAGRAEKSPMREKKEGSAGRQVLSRIPKKAQYLARTHRSAAGTRALRLYLPARHLEGPKGLILMLHGCSQTPDDFAIGTHMNARAERHGLVLAYPAQTGSHNAAKCWNWFEPGNQARGAGEPAILASLTRKLMKEFGVGRDMVFVAGLSAGGAMAAILADVYPDVFSAAGIHSGLARGSARDLISAVSAMRSGGVPTGLVPIAAARSRPVRRIIFQGADDNTVHPSNAATIVAAAIGSAAVPTRIGKRAAGGRCYARSDFAGSDGSTQIEHWMIEGAGHAWSGGRATGSYTDSKGPDASAQMIRFFMAKSD